MQLPEFKNEPLSDFKGNPEHARRMKEAVEEVAKELGRDYDLIIGGGRIKTQDKLVSYDPGQKDRVVGSFSKANKDLATRAIEVADQTFKTWSRVPAEERADLLLRTSKIIRERKYYYSAWLVYEVGKTWPEADADVAETIDFCEYYSREMLRLSKPLPLTPVPGEKNYMKYIPLGVGVVIPPWNFPMAILAGMTLASIVAGNTVVLKPSSDSPTVGYKFVEALEQAGMPPGVVNFCPCPGGSVGDVLVGHPRTRYIAFTGSKDVGLHINELAAKTAPGQVWIKRVLAEMGGKDSIIVDSETDLDQAVEGVAVSAFGYQGQKCSACSRVVVLEQVYARFLERLKAAAESLPLGPVEDPANLVGAVIDAAAQEKIRRFVDLGRREGKTLLVRKPPAGAGFAVPLAIFHEVKRRARIANEEIFGPVLSVFKVKDFDQALEVANDSPYALTGGVFSRSPVNLAKAVRGFRVGNLYLNRGVTGAVVGRHPFGGSGLSGLGTKAGGPDYLLSFLIPRTISENNLRRGFAPDAI